MTTPARPVKIAPSAARRATHRASGVVAGHGPFVSAKSPPPPFTIEMVHSRGWKNAGCVASLQCHTELAPNTALVAASPATTTTGTLPDPRALCARKRRTHSATITVTTIAIVVVDSGPPNHLNGLGNQVSAPCTAATTHSHAVIA